LKELLGSANWRIGAKGLTGLQYEPFLRRSPAFSAQPSHCRLNPISIELKEGKRRDRLLARDQSKQSSLDRGPISSLEGFSVELTPLLSARRLLVLAHMSGLRTKKQERFQGLTPEIVKRT